MIEQWAELLQDLADNGCERGQLVAWDLKKSFSRLLTGEVRPKTI